MLERILHTEDKHCNALQHTAQQTGTPVITNGAANSHAGYVDVPQLAPSPPLPSGELSPEHRAQLENESGISPEAIAARKPFSTEDPADLIRCGFSRAQSKAASKHSPVLVFPLYDHTGQCAGYVMRPDNPVKGREGKKYELPQGSAPILDVSRLTLQYLDDPAIPLYITEGAKKADCGAGHGLCVININGVYAFRGKNAKGGLTALADWEYIAIKGRTIYIVFDSDVMTKPAVQSALRRLWAFLKAKGAIVKVIYLPEGPNGEKAGLDDHFVRGGTREQLLELARELPTEAETRRERKEARDKAKHAELQATGLPIIETAGRQLRDKLRDLSAAIAHYNEGDPKLFTGAAGLVRLERDGTGQLRIIGADASAIQTTAAHAASWIATSEKFGVQDVNPPRDLCQNYLSHAGRYGVPPIETVMAVPFFAEDGTLCGTSGYYEAARAFLDLPNGFVLPDTSPTEQNIEAAKALLFDTVLGEVAFEDQSSRAHALALMILPFVRNMIPGATPLHLWDAPDRGSGKTYGAGLCVAPFARPRPTAEKNDKAEWRKALFTELLEGASHIFIDNIKSSLDSAALDAMLTASAVSERVLGLQKSATVPVRCVWVATSNNAQLTADITTRTVVIRLDPDTENPDLKQFKNNPEKFIWDNRPAVCGAIITLIRAWIEAGRPAYKGTNKIRFHEWRRVIGGILDVAGVPGFLDNAEKQRELLSNESSGEWGEFAGAWHAAHGEKFVSGADLVPIAEKFPSIEAVFIKAEKESEKSRKLLNALQHRRDKVFASFKIIAGPRVNRKSTYALRAKSPKNAPQTAESAENVQTTQTTQTTFHPRAGESFSS
ncbi:MAG TPA: DUF3854 domain-containing protein, partial [Abditibacteriaceae bacterium]